MSGETKQVAPSELRRWAEELTSMASIVEEHGRGCPADVDAGAVSHEVLLRAATMLEGADELSVRLRSVADTLMALSLNYDLSEAENAHTLGYLLGRMDAGPPPEISEE